MQNSILIADNIKIETNSTIATVKINHYNEANKDSTLSGVINNYVTAHDIRIYIVVKISSNSKIPDYNIEFLKTTVDVKKLFKGAFANPMVKSWTQNFFAAADFELKFPFVPVTQYRISTIYSYNSFAGNL